MKSNKSPLPNSITKPLYLYFESELEHLYHLYHKRKQHTIVNLIEQELKQRKAETYKVEFGVLPRQKPKAIAGLVKPVAMKQVTLQRIKQAA